MYYIIYKCNQTHQPYCENCLGVLGYHIPTLGVDMNDHFDSYLYQ